MKLKQREVINLFASRAFTLRKWIANNPGLVDWLDKDLLAIEEALQMKTDFRFELVSER